MSQEKVKKYFNECQQEAMAVAAKDEYIVASRAFGKSEGIDAPRLIRNVHAMPRSAGAIISPTYAKLLQNTLPAIFHALDRLGYKRNIHYFLGRKAPRNLSFQLPYINPFSYEHVIHWFNGSIQHLISFDRPMSANSMSLDYILAPEAKFLDYDKVKNEVLPANRGNINYFGDCPWHHGQVYTTDMPTNKTGQWILEKEKDMDLELINLVKHIYYDYKKLKSEANLTKTGKAKLNKLTKELAYFRSFATFFAEFNVIDNIELLGTKFIRDMKRDLPPLIFQTAILNKRIRKIENGFYPNLDEKVHYYESHDNSYLDNLRNNHGDIDLKTAQKDTCMKDGDIDPKKHLSIAFDYNANINWVVVGQTPGNKELRTLNAQYTKHRKKLRSLCDKWAEYYKYHQTKEVVYYYDATALESAYADEETETFADIVKKTLTKHGWNVHPIYIGKTMRHNLKHQYIDDGLTGKKYLFPTFNKYNCEYLLLAMEQTGVKIGRNGFEKDKSGEKLDETPEDPLETRTDSTDAWDTLFIGCNFFPFKKSSFSTSVEVLK